MAGRGACRRRAPRTGSSGRPRELQRGPFGAGEAGTSRSRTSRRVTLDWFLGRAQVAGRNLSAQGSWHISTLGSGQATPAAEEMTRFIGIFLSTDFTGEERHVRRIQMLADYEATGTLPPRPCGLRAPGGWRRF